MKKFELGIFGRGSFKFQPKNLPEIWISNLTSEIELSKYLSLVLKNKISTKEFARKLLTDLSYYSKNNKDKVPSLVIKNIDDDDLSNFCHLFTEKNKHKLIDFSKNNYEKNEDKESIGNSVNVILQYKDLPQEDNETNFDYLVRFLRTREELIYESYGKDLEKLNVLYKSEMLKPLLEKQLFIKDNLTSSINSLQQFQPSRNSVYEVLNEIKEVESNSGRLVEGLQNIVLNILNEAQSGSKKMAKFNYIMISIATLSLILTMVFSILTYNSNKDTNDYINKNSNAEVKLLKKQIDLQKSFLKEFKKNNKIDTLKISK